MGLDAFEIIHSIEESFDIELSVDDFQEAMRDYDITAGDLYELILRKLHLRDVARNDIRLNYHLWRKVQGILQSVTYVPLKQIELGTPLESLFPRESRRERWDMLQWTCPYRVRELDYPPLVRYVGLALAAGVTFIDLLQLWQVAGARWLMPLIVALGIWMVSETYLKLLSFCSHWRNHLPSGLRTVKDLCREVLAANYKEIAGSVEIPFDQRCVAVWEQLTLILATELAVPREEVTFRSRLVRDLGMDG